MQQNLANRSEGFQKSKNNAYNPYTVMNSALLPQKHICQNAQILTVQTLQQLLALVILTTQRLKRYFKITPAKTASRTLATQGTVGAGLASSN